MIANDTIAAFFTEKYSCKHLKMNSNYHNTEIGTVLIHKSLNGIQFGIECGAVIIKLSI